MSLACRKPKDYRSIKLSLGRDPAAKPGTPIEIEVDNLTQFERVLASQPTIVLLDNMSLADNAPCVEIRNQSAPAVLLEASGGITLRTIVASPRPVLTASASRRP